MRFDLEALQANDGDCLLLHYGPGANTTTRILIDGGSRGVYQSVLKPRLDRLRGQHPLDLRMVLVSHIDSDHITGVLDLFRRLNDLQDEGGDAFCRIRTLWHNAFETLHGGAPAAVASAAAAAAVDGHIVPGLDEHTQAVVASVPQGNRLRHHAVQLTIPVNQGAPGPLVLAPESGQARVKIADGLVFTILAPHKTQLDRLEDAWHKSQASHPADPAAQAADYLNRTVPNMSSIVVLAEAGTGGATKRMLLTGDAGGDVILEALEAAGLSQNGHSHFDLLKVQHHGSNHSTTKDFFTRVTADRYVISGNGRHGNPHPDALRWLSAARHGQPIEVFLTNRTGVDGLKEMFDTFLAEEARTEPKHVYRFRQDPELSITVELGT